MEFVHLQIDSLYRWAGLSLFYTPHTLKDHFQSVQGEGTLVNAPKIMLRSPFSSCKILNLAQKCYVVPFTHLNFQVFLAC